MAGGQVRTAAPDGTGWRYLSELGPVTGLAYSDTLPGGAEAMTCLVHCDPTERHEMLNLGRIVQVITGGVTWEGRLAEPVPGDEGWTVTATGLGQEGSRYRDVWTSWGVNNVVDAAITRGLRWVKPATLSGGTLPEKHDSASDTVTGLLNAYTSAGSGGNPYTWRVDSLTRELTVFQVPTTVTRILVTTVPALRTIAQGYVNALYVKYLSKKDTSKTAAAYGLTSSVVQSSIDAHGRLEEYADWSSAETVSTAGAMQTRASQALAKYKAATWGGPFQVTHGQYLNAGGAPVDLACQRAGEVVRLILADGPYGGEITGIPPVTFCVGRVEYHGDDGTLEITPMQSAAADWAAVLESIAPKAPA